MTLPACRNQKIGVRKNAKDMRRGLAVRKDMEAWLDKVEERSSYYYKSNSPSAESDPEAVL